MSTSSLSAVPLRLSRRVVPLLLRCLLILLLVRIVALLRDLLILLLVGIVVLRRPLLRLLLIGVAVGIGDPVTITIVCARRAGLGRGSRPGRITRIVGIARIVGVAWTVSVPIGNAITQRYAAAVD
jgi:hypothetical protein